MLLSPSDLRQQLETDGSLDSKEMSLTTVEQIRDEVWGQAFPEPTFSDTFNVLELRRMGEDGSHLRLTVEKDSKKFTAVKFRAGNIPVPNRVRAVFKLGANTFRGATSLQLLIDYFEAA